MTARRYLLAASVAAALAVYALLWTGHVLQWNWLSAMDSSALEALHRYGAARPRWVTGWDVFCTVFGPTVFRLLTLVVIVVALIQRKLRVALFLVISVELSGLVTEITKLAADRPRPEGALVFAHATAFPSGHALGVLVSVLALLTIALPVTRQPIRPWLIAGGAVIVIAIGVGRVVLNVHHPSDVLAGWALGYAYFVACVLIVPPARRATAADEIPEAPGTAR